MKTSIKTGIIVAGLLASSLAFANPQHHEQSGQGAMGMGDPAQMQKMMEQRMKMMKSELKLNAQQEKYFDAFASQKQAMMQEMMKKRQAMMKNMKGQKGMQGGQMGNMQGQGGMKGGQMGMGQGGMMQMMAGMSFEDRLKMMQDHGEKMLATASAGRKFYNSLSSSQKKKLNEMPKKMKGMNMSQMQ